MLIVWCMFHVRYMVYLYHMFKYMNACMHTYIHTYISCAYGCYSNAQDYGFAQFRLTWSFTDLASRRVFSHWP